MSAGVIRLRMSTADGHYGGGLVDGAKLLQLFGDAVTEMLIRSDGDEGLCATISADFLAPVHSGDFIEVRATLVETGKTSRKFECTAHKLIRLSGPFDSSADVLDPPQLVARAHAIGVVPPDKQRRPG